RRTAVLGRSARKADLLLDVGVENGMNGTRRIAWSTVPAAADLVIPLGRELWLKGRSHLTGRESVQTGEIAEGSLKAALLID
ncbi:MAG TPA: hypothetical protein VMM82_04870, partial [Spirochaetia bacterium]|nr:hypothetical protein [Spirochaetia bacterium]